MNTRPKTMSPRMTEAVRRYRAGEKNREAAAAMGISLAAYNSALNYATKRIDFVRDRPKGKDRQYGDTLILSMFEQGQRPIDISRSLDMPYSTVHAAIRRARKRGALPTPTVPTRRYVNRLRDAGALQGIGRLGTIVDTLTEAQLLYMLKQAPKAKTVAEAVAIHLALTLPEDTA